VVGRERQKLKVAHIKLAHNHVLRMLGGVPARGLFCCLYLPANRTVLSHAPENGAVAPAWLRVHICTIRTRSIPSHASRSSPRAADGAGDLVQG
jgi:hypothetical protein